MFMCRFAKLRQVDWLREGVPLPRPQLQVIHGAVPPKCARNTLGNRIGTYLDVKRPTRAVEELHQVAATRTERRLFAQLDSHREVCPIAFVDLGRLPVLIQLDLAEGAFLGGNPLTIASRILPWHLSGWGCRDRRLSTGRKTPDRRPALCPCRRTAYTPGQVASVPARPRGSWPPVRDGQ